MSDLPEILTLAVLVAGTLEYAFVMRHREERRQAMRLDELSARFGHQALVRMRLIDRGRPMRQWSSFGSRFR
jgi:hypothetical protein